MLERNAFMLERNAFMLEPSARKPHGRHARMVSKTVSGRRTSRRPALRGKCVCHALECARPRHYVVPTLPFSAWPSFNQLDWARDCQWYPSGSEQRLRRYTTVPLHKPILRL